MYKRQVADTVLAHQGKVIGIIPQFLQDREVSHPNLTKTVVVESMSERKNKMVELGDAYIALPGGPGTLEEIAEVISWARIGKNNNPCIPVSYTHLLGVVALMVYKMHKRRLKQVLNCYKFIRV